MNCAWNTGGWSAWGGCTATCGGGTQLRSRYVEQNAKNGGNPCTGSPVESQTCNTNDCPASMIFDFIRTSTWSSNGRIGYNTYLIDESDGMYEIEAVSSAIMAIQCTLHSCAGAMSGSNGIFTAKEAGTYRDIPEFQRS